MSIDGIFESGIFPVAKTKTVSPSKGVWTGRMERANPSCAIIATPCACALLRLASVATTQRVVLVDILFVKASFPDL